MKAFVAVVASLAASANAGVVLNGAPIINGAPLAAPAPLLPNTASVVAAPAVPHAQQFHTQDEFGNLAFGYSNLNSARHEQGNTYGGRVGSYSWVDANGVLQRTEYVADGLGFRVTGATNLPVAPAVPAAVLPVAPVDTGVAPLPVEETAEVKAARAEFQAAFDEAAAAHAVEKRSVLLPAAPVAYGAAPAAPAVGLPAARQTIQLTPGHAIFTRVYNLPGEPELINQQ